MNAITDQLAEALRPFAKMADRTPIMTGRGENTRERHPGDHEKYDFGADVTWGLLRYAKAAIAAYDAQPKVECSELVRRLYAGIPMRDGPLGKLPSISDAVPLMRQAADRIEELEATAKPESDLGRAVRLARGDNKPPTVPVRFGAAVTVTDEMVELAERAWLDRDEWLRSKAHDDNRAWYRANIRAALEAALSASAGKEGGE